MIYVWEFLNQRLSLNNDCKKTGIPDDIKKIDFFTQGHPQKKHIIFYDIESKGVQVAVSKPNFLNIRNYDNYSRRVGKRFI